MQLADQTTLEKGSGTVTYSQVRQAPGFRITTLTGASLICSDTAPIPTKSAGLVKPAQLLGHEVAVRWDEANLTSAGWEKIVNVESVGIIRVQHITVGDKCFWAGEKKGAYILHHNKKDDSGVRSGKPPADTHLNSGGGNENSHAAGPDVQHHGDGAQAVQLVGTAHPMVGHNGMM